jgi:hypothetical protein
MCINILRPVLAVLLIIPMIVLAGDRAQISDPAKACNYVLAAIHDEGMEKIASILSEENRKDLLPLIGDNREEMSQLIREGRELIGDVRKITELRKGPPFLGEGAVIGKVRVIQEEVIVVTMVKEGEFYYFDDLGSPSLRMYGELEKISVEVSP